MCFTSEILIYMTIGFLSLLFPVLFQQISNLRNVCSIGLSNTDSFTTTAATEIKKQQQQQRNAQRSFQAHNTRDVCRITFYLD